MDLMREELIEFALIAELSELPCQGLEVYERWLRANDFQLFKMNCKKANLFVEHLEQQEITPTSARRMLYSVQQFYIWYYKAEGLSPFRKTSIKHKQSLTKKRKTVNRKPLSQYQIDRCRASISRRYKDSPFEFYRAHLIFALPLYMGLSFYEMENLDVKEMKVINGYLHLFERDIPCTPEMNKLIRQYISYRAIKIPTTHVVDSLFISSVGVSSTTGTFSRILREIVKDTGTVINAQIMLDTFGYNLAADGAPVTVIMKLRDISYARAVTLINLATDNENESEAYEQSVMQRMRPVKRRVKRVP